MGEAIGEWVPTHTIAISGNTDRIPTYAGEHLWTWTATFRASPGAEMPMLDGENLLRIAGITCYYCRTEHSRRVAGRFCTGRR